MLSYVGLFPVEAGQPAVHSMNSLLSTELEMPRNVPDKDTGPLS